MPRKRGGINTSAKGKRAEKACMEELKAKGYGVSQAHLSRGVADVIAWKRGLGKSIGEIRFIQVKQRKPSSKHSKLGRKELREFAEEVPDNCSVELWRYIDGDPEPLKEVFESE